MAAATGMRHLPDVQIRDAINQKSWKVALQLIEKKQKKAKKTQIDDWIIGCKAHVLLMTPEPGRQQQGRALLDHLVERERPIYDVNTLSLLHFLADERNEKDSRMDTLWAKAAKAQPKNEELHETWFITMFIAKDFRGMQKV
ncbi:MAG: hypothetical protein Q9174_000024 [Haloplaca sp. 1 TL-2023]